MGTRRGLRRSFAGPAPRGLDRGGLVLDAQRRQPESDLVQIEFDRGDVESVRQGETGRSPLIATNAPSEA